MNKSIPILFFILFYTTGMLLAQIGPDSELQRLRQNYIRLTMMSENSSDPLTGLLVEVPRDQEAGDQMVVELQECYPIDPLDVGALLESLDSTGRWPDIDYADTKRSGWEPRKHVRRLLTLAKAYRSERMPYRDDPSVEEAIRRGMAYWFHAGLECRNWWYNQIGIPKTLGTVFLLFEEQMTPDEKALAIREMEKSSFGMTGQNKVWLAGNVLVRALLENDYGLAQQARDSIVSEIAAGGEEGIQGDWSFHQHGPQQQFGNYGLAFIRSMGFYSGLFAGTSFALEERQFELLSRLLTDGYRWILWKGMMDINALGRQLFRNAPVDKAFSLAFAARELAAGGNNRCEVAAEAILSDNFHPDPSVGGLTGHKHFQHSDLTIHRTPNWMASLKMASSRVIGTERVNEDNLKGFYMADGALYTYIDGDEYLNVFPYWDWRKIPGVTSYDTDLPVPVYHYTGPRARNRSSFVGGISDGSIGMSVMELNRDSLQAQKTWIFTDEFICAFGSGIHTDSMLRVSTSIDQRLKRDSLWSYTPEEGWSPVRERGEFTGRGLRFFHDKTGYIVPEGDPCIVEEGMRTGRWHDFMGVYRPEEVSAEIISIYLDHGLSPQNASYLYFILPDTDRSSVAAFDPSVVRIVRNDASACIINLPEKNVWLLIVRPVGSGQKSALKWEPEPGFTLHLQDPGLYLFRHNGMQWNRIFRNPINTPE